MLSDKIMRQPFYYARWYCCRNPECRTTTIMPQQFRVYREARELWGETAITSTASKAAV